jgi:hypothetical protein
MSQQPAARAQWTFMVYLAGDNNLEACGLRDLQEMKAAGSTPEVAIIAQFDGMSDAVARRLYLRQGGELGQDVVQVLPEVNTGDPAALADFLCWGAQNYPAEHYALVLWNHGSGWKDEDVYQAAQRQGLEGQVPRGVARGLSSGRPGRALFRTSLETLVRESIRRAILFDDTSADFLDNQEMRRVLQQAQEALGQPLDLIGFDACLMSMVEVHYQIRDLCRVAVSSQEVEPGNGWPYDQVLRCLTHNPAISAEELGQEIVRAYVEYYRQRQPNQSSTQSAVSLERLDGLVQAVSGLGQALKENLSRPETMGLLFNALRFAQSFRDRDYIDLAYFCRTLLHYAPGGPVAPAAQQVLACFEGPQAVVLQNAHQGAGVENASGLSIYLPTRNLSPLYQDLEFAHAGAWDDFLQEFIKPLRK